MRPWPSPRGIARRIYHGTDRLAHSVRRHRLLRALKLRGWPASILFVCHGNICRSPYAAAAFRKMLPEHTRARVTVGSAGFIGPNRPAPTESLNVSSRRGLDLSKHVSAQLSTENVRQTELLVVMNAAQQHALIELYGRSKQSVIVLGDLDPLPINTRAIRDPIGQSEEVYEASYDRIDRCLAELIAAFNASAASAEPIRRDA